MVCSPGLAHLRLTPDNCDVAALRRRDVGQPGQARPLRLLDQDARPRHRGARHARPPDRRGRDAAGSHLDPRPADHRGPGRHRAGRAAACLARRAAGRDAGRAPHRRARVRRGPRRRGRPVPAGAAQPGGVPLPPATAAEHAVHARQQRVGVPGRDAQPDVLAGTTAGDPAHRGDLPVPPGDRGGGLPGLVRRPRAEADRLRRGDARGRGRDAGRARHRGGRHGRAQLAAGRDPAGQGAVQGGRRRARDRWPACPARGPRCTSTRCSPSATATW